MRITKISMAGFRGVRGRLDLAVQDGFLVITGRNGSGKSTVCDAIEFALTGRLSRFEARKEKNESIADYLWWRGDGRAGDRFVQVDFITDGGRPITLRRDPSVRAAADLSQYVDDFCTSERPSENWTADLVNTMFVRDETIAALSIDLPESDRFTVVERALGIGSSARYENLLTAAQTALRSRIAASERAHAAKRDTIVSLTADLARATASDVSEERRDAATSLLRDSLRLTIEQASDGSAIEAAFSDFRQRNRAVELLSHEIVDAIANRDDLLRQSQEKVATEARDRAADLDRQIVETRERVKELDAQIAAELVQSDYRNALAQLAVAAERLGLLDEACPLCRTRISSEHLDQEIARLRREAGERSRRHAEAIAARESYAQGLLSQTSKRDQLRQFIDGLAIAVARAEQKIVDLRDRLAILMGGDSFSLEAIRTWLQKQAELTSRLESAIGDLVTARLLDRSELSRAELDAAKREGEAEAQKLENIRRAEESVATLLRAVKQVSKEIVDERLAAAEPLLTELYRRLRPHSDWLDVSFRIRGEIRKFLSFRVGDDINPSFVFSSGQRRAAGLAFLLAVHLARNWCRLRTLVLDDPVQHIDDFRALHLVETLSAIRKTGRQIICSVEDPALADLLVRRLQVAPLAGGSRIELRHDPISGVVVESEAHRVALPQNVVLSA